MRFLPRVPEHIIRCTSDPSVIPMDGECLFYGTGDEQQMFNSVVQAIRFGDIGQGKENRIERLGGVPATIIESGKGKRTTQLGSYIFLTGANIQGCTLTLRSLITLDLVVQYLRYFQQHLKTVKSIQWSLVNTITQLGLTWTENAVGHVTLYLSVPVELKFDCDHIELPQELLDIYSPMDDFYAQYQDAGRKPGKHLPPAATV